MSMTVKWIDSRFPAALMILLLAANSVLADCACRKVGHAETTRWGGNELIIVAENKPRKELRGVVKGPNDEALYGALVEVWDNPEYLLSEGSKISEGRAKQKRLKACNAANDGSFCFHLKPGKYELRLSVGAGWDVTSVYVAIDPHASGNSDLTIQMQLGT
jgi:hypothetical protein